MGWFGGSRLRRACGIECRAGKDYQREGNRGETTDHEGAEARA
jgi:hypothetical protein